VRVCLFSFFVCVRVCMCLCVCICLCFFFSDDDGVVASLELGCVTG
jgi:hypothetical protein